MKLVRVAGWITVAVSALIAWVVLLRPPDLTAAETARALQRGNAHWRHVECSPGSDGWDYTCGYTYSLDGEDRRESIAVDVNAEHVTNRSAP